MFQGDYDAEAFVTKKLSDSLYLCRLYVTVQEGEKGKEGERGGGGRREGREGERSCGSESILTSFSLSSFCFSSKIST